MTVSISREAPARKGGRYQPRALMPGPAVPVRGNPHYAARMTERLPDTQEGIAHAAALLKAGELVAFGTETVYGLGADATNAQAVAAIFAVKGRPRFNPLIAHYADAEDAFTDTAENNLARRLAEAFWPGPLTFGASAAPRRLPGRASGERGIGPAGRARAGASIGARSPARGGPAGRRPSANPSGRISPTTADHVLEGLGGRIAAVLDCGVCGVGVEFTVLNVTEGVPVLLRPGGITKELIEAIAGPVQRNAASRVLAPGMLASHYAPHARLRLNATHPRDDEALLAFGPTPAGASTVYQLSEHADLTEAAARLFDGLHVLDRVVATRGLSGIAAMPVPQTDLGLAINDRLNRAATRVDEEEKD